MEFSVIKIIDGILISDGSIINDYEFILNNKISHVIGPNVNNLNINAFRFEDLGIKFTSILKTKQQLTTSIDIQKCIQSIIQSRDECLCCLIYGQNLYNVLVLLIPYFVCRYGWAVQTSTSFIQRRLNLMNIPNLEECMQNLRQQLPQILNKMLGSNKNKLKKIQWNRKFLESYKTDDMQEQIVINTVKNTLSTQEQIQDSQYIETRLASISNKRRVVWHDQASKNTIVSGQKLFANSRINSSLKKSSSLKNFQHRTSIKVPTNQPILNNNNKQRLPSAKKLGQSLKQSQFDDFDYLSLKELSRTNFDDMKFKGSGLLYKRRGFKGQKHSIINQHQNYRKKNIIKIAEELNKQNNNKALNFIQGVKSLQNKYLRA